MATRVFELAREIGVTSKVILDKCRAEDIDLKNHMAVLSAGLEATIREWFSESAASTAVETSQHVDLEAARALARKSRRRSSRKEKEDEAVAAALAEQAVETPPGEPQAPTPAAAAAEPAAAAQGDEQETPAAEPAVAAETTPAAVKPAETAAPADKPQQIDNEKNEKNQPKGGGIKAAGPQVVPRPAQLRGPRVVRVEKPDFVPVPPARSYRPPRPGRPGVASAAPMSRPPMIGEGLPKRGGKPPAKIEGGDESEESEKKGKRSPRRRGGGRSAASGEGVKEWRDTDLAERSARLAAATSGLRRHRPALSHRAEGSAPALKSSKIQIEEPLTIKGLSAATGIKTAEIIRKLMDLGVMATANQTITRELAETQMVDYGIELEIKRDKSAEESVLAQISDRPPGKLVSRAPVVTFLGHVDHGKTSLLDHIRKETVAAGEAGGITQHIGAYRYDIGDKHVVFLDTPGHEAFTAMRSRGANMTDVVVLVVAADDGVMPQTEEAISHAKAAKVPIVVALNKSDLPNANIPRVMGQLAEHGLNPREWGGDVEVIQTSAVTGMGMDRLVETLSLEAELLELKADADAPAGGYVIEAQMDSGLGVVARLLVLSGTLRVGDVLLAGKSYGRVRQIMDDKGHVIAEAGPSTPVQVSGLDTVPEAGDKFYVVADIEQARAVAEERLQQARSDSMASKKAISMESLVSKIESGMANTLPIILKADVQGSIEAIVGSLNKITTANARVEILHAGVGGISTGDVSLAEAYNAIIIGFNVVAD